MVKADIFQEHKAGKGFLGGKRRNWFLWNVPFNSVGERGLGTPFSFIFIIWINEYRNIDVRKPRSELINTKCNQRYLLQNASLTSDHDHNNQLSLTLLKQLESQIEKRQIKSFLFTMPLYQGILFNNFNHVNWFSCSFSFDREQNKCVEKNILTLMMD